MRKLEFAFLSTSISAPWIMCHKPI